MTQLISISTAQNQYLIPDRPSSYQQTFCKGFTNGERDFTLDGDYFNQELVVIKKPVSFRLVRERDRSIKLNGRRISDLRFNAILTLLSARYPKAKVFTGTTDIWIW